MEAFSRKTIEEIGFYVYCLFDPHNAKIFYVGKGIGNRVFKHLYCALEDSTESDKLETIRDILQSGVKVGHYIIRHGLAEDVAYTVESCLIDLLIFPAFKEYSNITNLVSGHDSWDNGIKTVDEIEALYSAKQIMKTEIKHKVIIININKTYKPGVSPYEATRQSWRMNIEKAQRAEFVLCEYKSIIRKVYRPEKWILNKDGKRCLFEGVETDDRSVLDLYLNRQLVGKKRGQANPIQYVNL